MAQGSGLLLPTGEIWVKFLAAGCDLTQPWPLQPLGSEPARVHTGRCSSRTGVCRLVPWFRLGTIISQGCGSDVPCLGALTCGLVLSHPAGQRLQLPADEYALLGEEGRLMWISAFSTHNIFS